MKAFPGTLRQQRTSNSTVDK